MSNELASVDTLLQSYSFKTPAMTNLPFISTLSPKSTSLYIVTIASGEYKDLIFVYCTHVMLSFTCICRYQPLLHCTKAPDNL